MFEQEGLNGEVSDSSRHRRLAALQEWLVERMGRGPPRIAHLPDHLLFSFLPAAFTLFVQPGSDPATDLTAQQCQVCHTFRMVHSSLYGIICLFVQRMVKSERGQSCMDAQNYIHLDLDRVS